MMKYPKCEKAARIAVITGLFLLTGCGSVPIRPESAASAQCAASAIPESARPLAAVYHDQSLDTVHNAALTATWYGRPYHGRKTANGERYNMYTLTAAHRSLPFGTRLRVRNPRNGKVVVVRINDRGPFNPRAELDLSYAAARKLGVARKGIAELQVRKLS